MLKHPDSWKRVRVFFMFHMNKKMNLRQLSVLTVLLTLGFTADLSGETNFRLEKIKDLTELHVESVPLSFIFKLNNYDGENRLFYSCMLNASMNPELFNYMVVGKELSDIPPFQGGTGMAPSQDGYYKELILNDKGNHYLFFDPEGSPSRVHFLKDYGDSALVSVRFDRIFDGEKTVLFNEISDQIIFLIFFFDRNLNKIVDKGEFRRVALRIN